MGLVGASELLVYPSWPDIRVSRLRVGFRASGLGFYVTVSFRGAGLLNNDSRWILLVQKHMNIEYWFTLANPNPPEP